MEVSIRVNEVKNKDNIKGFATVVFGDAFKITNIAILENKETGNLFVSMPRYRSNELDENGGHVYKDVCNPITAEFREELYSGIITAYENIANTENEQKKNEKSEIPSFKVSVVPFEKEGSNIKGLARVYFDDCFVVSNINILQGKEKVFVAMPSYKTKQVDENGKSKELTAMRKQLVEMDNKTLAAGIKEAINKSITKSQIAINDMKEKVSEIKSEMKAKAKNIVDEIKLKGKAALNRVAEFTRLTSKLAYVREGIREGIKETDKTIERINGFGHGMRNAGRQIVNSFRVLAGHEEKESSEDKKMYIIGILRSPWVGQKEVYEGMERVLNGAIDRLENLSKEMTEEKSKDNKSSYDGFENEKSESMEMVGPEWEMEVAEEEKFYGDEFFQPEEEIEFIDLDDVPEKKMVAEGKSR